MSENEMQPLTLRQAIKLSFMVMDPRRHIADLEKDIFQRVKDVLAQNCFHEDQKIDEAMRDLFNRLTKE